MKINSITTIVAVLALGTLGLQAKDKKPGKGGAYSGEEVVKTFDKNADDKLSLEEFSAMKKFAKDKDPAAAAKKAFTEADADKDGFVTGAELQAVHEKKMAKGDAKKPAAAPATTTPAAPAK